MAGDKLHLHDTHKAEAAGVSFYQAFSISLLLMCLNPLLAVSSACASVAGRFLVQLPQERSLICLRKKCFLLQLDVSDQFQGLHQLQPKVEGMAL